MQFMMQEAGGCIRGEGKMSISVCLKAMGCAMMIGGTSGYGWWLADQYKRRVKELEKLRQMVYLVKAQIIYANATLEEALRAVGERGEEAAELTGLFLSAAAQIAGRPGESFAQIWRGAVGQMGTDSPLKESDRQSLAGMADHLGFLDRETQERHLLLYLEELDGTIAELKEQKKGTCRLYTSLGIMSGMFLSVLFC